MRSAILPMIVLLAWTLLAMPTEDSFWYTISDGNGGFATATVFITVGW